MFSEILYRGYGPHQRKGGGFSTLGVSSESAYAEALASGWYRTLPEAISAHDGMPAPAAQPITKEDDHVESLQNTEPEKEATSDEDAASVIEPVTAGIIPRAELEAMARELGLKFDGRTTDAKLARMVDARLGS